VTYIGSWPMLVLNTSSEPLSPLSQYQRDQFGGPVQSIFVDPRDNSTLIIVVLSATPSPDPSSPRTEDILGVSAPNMMQS